MAEHSDEGDGREVLIDLVPYLTKYKDGGVEKFDYTIRLRAGLDQIRGVKSKDVTIKISEEKKILVRLYLPKDATPENKYPVVVYYHGGGFVLDHVDGAYYHEYLNYQVEHTNAVSISVEYRLAPEHPLPTAYEDAWLALKWIAVSKQEWIKEYADLNRVFLGGDDCGANIAHNIAMRFGAEKINGINLCGMFLNCPLFWGEEPIGDEEKERGIGDRDFYNRLLSYVFPTIKNLDDPCINPAKDPNLSSLGCKRVLIIVAGNYILKDRGWHYKEALSNSGWDGDVEILNFPHEIHIFTVKFSVYATENTPKVMKKIGSFVNQTSP